MPSTAAASASFTVRAMTRRTCSCSIKSSGTKAPRSTAAARATAISAGKSPSSICSPFNRTGRPDSSAKKHRKLCASRARSAGRSRKVGTVTAITGGSLRAIDGHFHRQIRRGEFRRRRHATLSLDCPLSDDSNATFADLVATDTPSPVGDVVTAEFSALVASCMEQLEANHREILTMRNLLDRPSDEIARALGINVGTVKSRMARAREDLRSLLAKACPEFSRDATTSDWFESDRPASRLERACA